MKPVLVLALGNALAGDDGVACEVAARLERTAALVEHADVHCCGTDLLRAAARMRGRRRLIIVDAVLAGPAGETVEVVPHAALRAHGAGGAHALDPVAALELLRSLDPEIAAADAHWVLCGVRSIQLGAGLTPAAAALLPAALEAVLTLAAPLPAAC